MHVRNVSGNMTRNVQNIELSVSMTSEQHSKQQHKHVQDEI